MFAALFLGGGDCGAELVWFYVRIYAFALAASRPQAKATKQQARASIKLGCCLLLTCLAALFCGAYAANRRHNIVKLGLLQL